MIQILSPRWPAIRQAPRVILSRYRAFLGEHVSCIVPGCCAPVTLHHALGRGFARNAASDVGLIAICHFHGVVELHYNLGSNEAFERSYRVGFNARINEQLQMYYHANGWPFIHETQEEVEQFLLEQE